MKKLIVILVTFIIYSIMILTGVIILTVLLTGFNITDNSMISIICGAGLGVLSMNFSEKCYDIIMDL